MRKLREFDCIDCGRHTERRRNTGQPLVCIDCAVQRQTAWNLQQAQERLARHPMCWDNISPQRTSAA